MEKQNRGSLPIIGLKHQSKGYSRWLGKRREEGITDEKPTECSPPEPPKHFSMAPSIPCPYIPQVSLDLGEDPISLTLPSITSLSSIGGLSLKNQYRRGSVTSGKDESEDELILDVDPCPEIKNMTPEDITGEERKDYCSQLGFSESTLQDIACFSRVSVLRKDLEDLEPKEPSVYEPSTQDVFSEERENIKALEGTVSKEVSDFKLEVSELSTTTTAVANQSSTPQVNQAKKVGFWNGIFNRASSSERRLFRVLWICAMVQSLCELFLLIVFILKSAYLAFGASMCISIPLTFSGILASKYRGRKYLGVYCLFMVIWQTWATLHVTLMTSRPANLVTEEEFHSFLANSFLSPDAELHGFSVLIITLYATHLLLSIVAVIVILSWFLFPTQARPHWELSRRPIRMGNDERVEEGIRNIQKDKEQAPDCDLLTAPTPKQKPRFKALGVCMQSFSSLKVRMARQATVNTQNSRASNGSDFFHTANSGLSSYIPTRPASWLEPKSPERCVYSTVSRDSLPPSLVSDQEGASTLPSPLPLLDNSRPMSSFKDQLATSLSSNSSISRRHSVSSHLPEHLPNWYPSPNTKLADKFSQPKTIYLSTGIHNRPLPLSLTH